MVRFLNNQCGDNIRIISCWKYTAAERETYEAKAF
jgi:hypothetical protein